MEIRCKYSELVPLDRLVPSDPNPNKHSKQQIELLAKLMRTAWRHPVIISKQSGIVRAGHARIEAAKLNEWTEVPVDYQDFKDLDEEIAFLVADNKIQELAESDDEVIQGLVLDLGPDFDTDLFGIPDFKIGALRENAFEEPDEKGAPVLKHPQLKMCPNCGVVIENG